MSTAQCPDTTSLSFASPFGDRTEKRDVQCVKPLGHTGGHYAQGVSWEYLEPTWRDYLRAFTTRVPFWKERRVVRDWWVQAGWDWSCVMVGINFGVPNIVPGAWLHVGPLILGVVRRKG